jgi:hypothetical protein
LLHPTLERRLIQIWPLDESPSFPLAGEPATHDDEVESTFTGADENWLNSTDKRCRMNGSLSGSVGSCRGDELQVTQLSRNAERCMNASLTLGWEYEIIPLSEATMDFGPPPAHAPLRVQELFGQLEQLYFRGGVSVSAWVSCTENMLEKMFAESEAQVYTRLESSQVDPVGNSGLGSLGHVFACGRMGDARCAVAVGTKYASATIRLLGILKEVVFVRHSAWPRADEGGDPLFTAWLMRPETLDSLAASQSSPILSIEIESNAGSGPRNENSSKQQSTGVRRSSTESHVLPPMRVAQYGMWASVHVVMEDLDVLSRLFFTATGRSLAPVNKSLTAEEQLDTADVILLGPYGVRAISEAVVRQYANRSLTIYIGPADRVDDSFHDQMVGFVHVSLGYRRDLVHPTYSRLPGWLPYSIDFEALPTNEIRFSQLLTSHVANGFSDAARWAARPRSASLFFDHAVSPQRTLLELLVNQNISIDSSSHDFRYEEKPIGLAAYRLINNASSLASYRYAVCPENSESSRVGGFFTNELALALMAGTVPIFWGNVWGDVDTQVFNKQRTVFFDGSSYDTQDALLTIHSLESDPTFREQWFDRPILAPTAHTWLRIWCGVVTELFRSGLARLDSVRFSRVHRPPSGEQRDRA